MQETTAEGEAYWYNTLTGESSWEPPPGAAQPEAEPQQAEPAQQAEPEPAPHPPPEAPLPFDEPPAADSLSFGEAPPAADSAQAGGTPEPSAGQVVSAPASDPRCLTTYSCTPTSTRENTCSAAFRCLPL